EVVEDVLLLGEVSGAVPFFTELAAAAEVGDGVDTALFQPHPADEVEPRHLAAAVAAVAIKDGRVLAVELGSFFANDVECDTRAVFRHGELANHLAIAEVGRRRAEERRL